MKQLYIVIIFFLMINSTFAQSNSENDFADKILQSNSFQEQKEKIENLSSGERTLKLIQVSEPSENAPYFYFKAAEDNGTNYVTHIHFRAYLESGRIVIYDPLEDEEIEMK